MLDQAVLSTGERNDVLRTIAAARDVADDAISYILSCLEHTSVANRVYARRHRVKSERDIEQKVFRKRTVENKPGYVWTDITDVVGLRFITLYRDDIFPVTDVIMRALLGQFDDLGPCPFERRGLKEVRLFMSNTLPTNDALAMRMQDLTSRLRTDADEWKFGGAEMGERYSSIHFVTWARPRRKAHADVARVPIEIQVRSVFEDAWGEVDHGLLYEPRRQGVSLDGPYLLIERHSNALKKMMDAAADFADAIRLLKTSDQPPLFFVRPTIDGPHYVESVCAAIRVPDAITEQLMALVRQKEELDNAVGGKLAVPLRAEYIGLADGFAALRVEQEAYGGFLFGKSEVDERQFYYLTRMEESVCRLLSLDTEQQQLAIDGFVDITTEFPSHALAWFRLGEAYTRLLESLPWSKEAEDAVRNGDSAFSRAGEEVSELASLAQRQRLFAASDVQERYLHENLGRVHAYLLWRAEHRRRGKGNPDADTLAVALKALDVTWRSQGRVSSTEARRRHLSGMIFYAAEAAEVAKHLDVELHLPFAPDDLRPFIKELEEAAKKLESDQSLPLWDSIAYALWMLKGPEAARDAASQVLLAHQELVGMASRVLTDYRREQEALAYRRALAVLGIQHAPAGKNAPR